MSRLGRLAAACLAGFVALAGSADAAAGGAVPSTDSPVELVAGLELERRLAPGEAHAYAVDLVVGDFLHVVCEQDGIDLVVTLEPPRGEPALFDDPHPLSVPERIAVVAAADGAHRLEVRPHDSVSEAGVYRLRVAARRPATPADRLRAEAEAATYDAHRLAARRTAEDLRAAVGALASARDLWHRLGDETSEARAWHRRGVLQGRLGENDEALRDLGGALELARRSGRRRAVADSLASIATIYRRLGQNERALAVYERALAIRRELGDPSGAARIELRMGHALQAMGEPRRALGRYEAALGAFRAAGDRLRQGSVLASLGPLHADLGRVDRAAGAYEQALAFFRNLGRRDLEADALNNLGLTLEQLGEPRAAIESYEAARDLYAELGDGRRQAAALVSLGRLLLDLGLAEEARPLLRRGLELLEASPDAYLAGRARSNLGAVERELGNGDAALRHFADALLVQRRSGDRAGEAWTVLARSRTRLAMGDATAGEDDARHALAIFRQVENGPGEIHALQALGEIFAARGRIGEATERFHAAAEAAAVLGDPTARAEALRELGRLERDAGRPGAALAHLEPALDLLEGLRTRIAGDHLRAAHFAALRATYELAVDARMQLHAADPEAGHDRRALALSERARARGLLDVLERARTSERRDDGETGDPELRARERALRRELAALASRPPDERPPDERDEERIDRLAAELHVVRARLDAAADFGGAPPEVSADELAPRIGEDAVLLEYALGEPRSHLWVIAAGRLESFELPGRRTLEEAARRVHGLLAEPGGDRGEERRALEQLARWLLEPAYEHLLRRRWLVVPDGALHYVPFAALPVPAAGGSSEPLVAEHEVRHLPAASLLTAQKEAPSPPGAPFLGDLAVVADPAYGADGPPRLEWSATEARDVAETVAEAVGEERVLLALGSAATRELVLGPELGRHRVVHFATHGVLDARHPHLSGLALAPAPLSDDGSGDPFLRLHDVYGLRWPAELVVLSGCRTALGREMRGEGLVGLARGFLHAGAEGVVASLWAVRDQATAELMRHFYLALFRDGESPGAALAAAQRAIRRERRWRDPYFWAPFVLVGGSSPTAHPVGEARLPFTTEQTTDPSTIERRKR